MTNDGVFPYAETEDEVLMLRYVQGDEKAFEELYRRYRGRAYGYLSNRLKDPNRVDEIFQKVFLKLHRSREQYDLKRAFSAWFFTICRTAVIDEYRQRGREMRMEPLTEQTIPAPTPNTRNENESPMAVLPDRQREAVRMRFEEDLDFDEIGRRLNTTAENVRQLVSRGIRKLRASLEKKS